MRGKFFGLFAAVLLAGPMAADASVIYELSSGQGGFVIKVPDFITSDIYISAGNPSLVSCVSSGGGCIGVYFEGSTLIWDVSDFQAAILFQSGVLGTVGEYEGSSSLLDDVLLKVSREHPSVPEPATLALLGLGLAGVGFSAARRRRVN